MCVFSQQRVKDNILIRKMAKLTFFFWIIFALLLCVCSYSGCNQDGGCILSKYRWPFFALGDLSNHNLISNSDNHLRPYTDGKGILTARKAIVMWQMSLFEGWISKASVCSPPTQVTYLRLFHLKRGQSFSNFGNKWLPNWVFCFHPRCWTFGCFFFDYFFVCLPGSCHFKKFHCVSSFILNFCVLDLLPQIN